MSRYYRKVDGHPPITMNRLKLNHRDHEGLSAEWHVENEAESFLHLFRTGKDSLTEMEWEIRMSDVELAELIREYPEDRVMLERIQAQRAKTWNALLGMLTEEDRAIEQDRKLKFPPAYVYLDVEKR